MRKHFPDIPRRNAFTDTKPDACTDADADADANTNADTNADADTNPGARADATGYDQAGYHANRLVM